MKPVALQEARDTGCFGGKSVSLGHAIRCGLPVPGGFALSADLVESLAQQAADTIDLLKSHIPEINAPMAVRSSAVGEDSAEASFAGQHETVLNVHTHEALIEAVCRVFDSAHSESALAYRRKLGIEGGPRIGVTLQELIDPDCAGVMFTRHPVTGADEFLVEASWGLGETVVSGLVEPDSYRLSRSGQALETRAGLKDIVLKPAPGGGTMESVVDEPRASALCLNDSALRSLHGLAMACEEHYGTGLDIEWAVAGAELYLLQCRAITTIG